MKKSFIRLFFISLFVFVFAALNIGSSDFVVNGEVKVDNISINDGDRAVCYIDGSTPTYFTTIERALEVAGAGDKKTTAETIYVIPNNVDKNVTITRNCTISANDTLILPYQDKLWDFREGPSKLRNRFADDCDKMIEQNRKTVVRIQKGVTLTVDGTLNIGGILGNAAPDVQGLQGQTSGFYSEILMEAGTDIHTAGGAKKGAQIQVNGTIDCRGYIKETAISDDINIQPQMVVNKTASLSLPFVVYDFQGASATGAIFCGNASIGVTDIGKTLKYDGKACPFVLFDFPNVQIFTKIYSGATVTALVGLHTNEQTILGFTFKESWNSDQFTLIGETNYLLSINQNGYITARYKPAHLGYTEALIYSDNPTRTTVDFYGECSFGAMQMTLDAQIAKVEINTQNILFPFSYRWAFNIRKDGKINVSNGIKFMNGCSMNVDVGGTLELSNGAKVVFYNQTWTDNKTTIPYLPTYQIRDPRENATLQNLTAENELVVKSNVTQVTGTTPLINNGTINLKSGAALGGLIQTNSEEGKVIVENGAVNNADSLETNGSGGREGLEFVFKPKDSKTLSEKAQMHAINDFTSLPVIDVSSGTYEGTKLNGSYGFGTRVGSATIKGDDSILPKATKTFEITDNSSHLLGDDFVWSCDDEKKLALNSKSGRSITVTGLEYGQVMLTCKIRYKGSDIKTVTKSIMIEKEPYVNVSVSVDTSSIYDNPSDPYKIGGVSDYRDITVTLDTNCTNYKLNWVYDSSKVKMVQTSGSYPTFTYHMTTIAAGSDALRLNFTSDEITKYDCWTQNITVANNKRITYLEVDPTTFSGKVSTWSSSSFTCKATVNTDGNLPSSILWKYIKENGNSQIKTISLNGNEITITGKGQSVAYQKYTSTFYIYCNNGINGAEVRSDTLTLEVHS